MLKITNDLKFDDLGKIGDGCNLNIREVSRAQVAEACDAGTEVYMGTSKEVLVSVSNALGLPVGLFCWAPRGALALGRSDTLVILRGVGDSFKFFAVTRG